MPIDRPDTYSVGVGEVKLSDIFGGSGNQAIRGEIINERSGEAWVFFFNPAEIVESYSADYNIQTPMGMSHGYHQFKATKNASFTFELYFNRMLLESRLGDEQDRTTKASDLGQDAKAFLTSLLYPPDPDPQLGPSEGIIGAAPPAARIQIGNVLSVRARMITLAFRHVRFDKLMRPMIWYASTRWDEAPISRHTMEDIRMNGSFR